MNWYKKAQTSSAPFLETPQQAWEWAKENVDIQVDEGAESEHDKAILESYLDKAEQYSDKYHEIKDLPAITIYRAIRVKSVEDINWDNIGTHWSFEKSGAGVYGDIPYGLSKQAKDILLTGITEPKYIDWEYCFTSFMYYGSDQWECSLDDGSPVTITHINDKTIEPIKGQA